MSEEELKKMTVKQLKELAAEKTDLTGLSGMKKEVLIKALIEKLHVEAPKKVTGAALKDKQTAKIEIRRLKQKKQELLRAASRNPQQLRNVRRRVRNLKRFIRKV